MDENLQEEKAETPTPEPSKWFLCLKCNCKITSAICRARQLKGTCTIETNQKTNEVICKPRSKKKKDKTLEDAINLLKNDEQGE